MDKLIKKLLKNLKIEFYCCWAICILFYVLVECILYPFAGSVAPGSQTEYVLQCLCVLLMLAGIPLALKLFTLNTTKNLKRMNFDEALVSYHIWSIVRLGILWLVAVVGITFYFLMVNVACLFCTLIALVTTFLCYPSEAKIRRFLETLNNEDN